MMVVIRKNKDYYNENIKLSFIDSDTTIIGTCSKNKDSINLAPYSAIIFIPFDSTKSNIVVGVLKLESYQQQTANGPANMAFTIGRKDVTKPIDVLKNSCFIDIDTTQYTSTLNLNVDLVKIFTLSDVCNHISKEHWSFLDNIKIGY